MFGHILAVIAASAAHAGHPVDHGVIHVGRGAVGVRIGMKRSVVRARLGKPVRRNRFDNPLQYQPKTSERYDARGFDVYFGPGGRVRQIDFTFPKSNAWRLESGIRPFRAHAVDRLYHTYGDRVVRAPDPEGAYSFQIENHLGCYDVFTVFYVTTRAPKRREARVYRVSVDASYQGAILKRCRDRR